MYKLYPYFTNDGSVGLFSPTDDDIYHSTYGAASEAYEKFIFPADFDKYIANNNKIKILDICFGIGYNSKSFLNYFLNYKKNFLKRQKLLSEYNDKIHTNNIEIQYYSDMIYTDNTNKVFYNEQLYSDNISGIKTIKDTHGKNFKIYIKAIDVDKNLAYLSPFIKSGCKQPLKNYKLPFENANIEKLLRFPSTSKVSNDLISYPVQLNVILLNKIIENNPKIFDDIEFNQILYNTDYKKYLSPYICGLYAFYKAGRVCNSHKGSIKSFLHNIYYKYISKRYKKALNSQLFNNFVFDLKIRDARLELLDDKNQYDFIFLDAFTPSKCPALWTVDFFKLLFSHLSENGKILTYSNSAAVRNAMINAGFYVGKIYNEFENKFTGTIAVKNKNLIKNELSDYDLGLLKTRAGIFYRDENLIDQNESIIERHKIEVNNSPLMSSSKYIKQMRCKG